MENDPLQNEEYIIIGTLAKMYNISKRTLRLYHDMGLLTPFHIDEKTGYRYYSSKQLPRLEMILSMKSAGLSLKQIKLMMSTKNISLFEAVLGEQIDKVNAKIAEYKVFRDSLVNQLDSCKQIQNPPVLNTIFIDYIPRRTAFIHQIDSYDLHRDYSEGSPWKKGLNQIKSIFMDKNVPLALFHQVGCIISEASLLHNQFICSGAFIQLHNDRQYGLPLSSIDPGTYLCLYQKYAAMDSAQESRGVQILLNNISENNYQIAGPCLTQVIAEASIFDYNDNNIYVKHQIPIKINMQ
ncbi:MAG: MerR family transcriptional regulator [Eubacteriaceae bacterium]|nr:MerR family transcriptional regulator [Eubacteriaceae bacterium]